MPDLAMAAASAGGGRVNSQTDLCGEGGGDGDGDGRVSGGTCMTVTFDRDVAMTHDDIEFISLDHPLAQKGTTHRLQKGLSCL